MRRESRTRLLRYRAYAKQAEFHAAGAIHRERLLMAANQVGKTYCGAAEAAIHLTGRYPDWWVGKRFDHPVRAWAGSVRYAIMMRRFARQSPSVEKPRPKPQHSGWAARSHHSGNSCGRSFTAAAVSGIKRRCGSPGPFRASAW